MRVGLALDVIDEKLVAEMKSHAKGLMAKEKDLSRLM